ncbi:hypothetical protein PALI_a2235 [Pseudoalteromonas aliena SW19]|uniref:Uncharacterized protein n=1 Tax=Pseudoalteromonas aliena SW19 TaxID=1314866 RepID=A0ABR9E0Z0_9GAMM|nr:hypothetical protein [Pseudoalteromonas aliena SW19]
MKLKLTRFEGDNGSYIKLKAAILMQSPCIKNKNGDTT